MRCTPLPREPVEVGRQRGHEGLALAGLHLGDPAEVQRGAAHQLDVEVALADRPGWAASRMTANASMRRSSRSSPLREPLAELGGLGLQLRRRRAPRSRARGVDVGHEAGERLELLAFAGAEDAIEDAHGGASLPGSMAGTRVRTGRPVADSWVVKLRAVIFDLGGVLMRNGGPADFASRFPDVDPRWS